MGVVVTEGRKLAGIVGIVVALTLLVTISAPIVPTIMYSDIYLTNHCLVTDPPPPDCLKIIEKCDNIGCGFPECGDECPYLETHITSLIDVWSVDYDFEMQKSIELHSGYTNHMIDMGK